MASFLAFSSLRVSAVEMSALNPVLTTVAIRRSTSTSARRVAHVGALGGEVDRRLDAGQLVQLLFDARRAGGTGHAAQRQLDGVAIAGGGILRRVHPDFPFKY
jgi:hypothetical protein